MQSLYVLYDEHCSLCRRARRWLERQSQLVPLRFVPAGQEAAKSLFPSLDHEATLVELTVIADSGEIFRGAKAWVLCLWALRDYRSLAFTMRARGTWWAAQRFVNSVSRHRHKILSEHPY